MGITTTRNYRLLLYANTLAIVLIGAAVAVWGMFWMLPPGLGDSFAVIHASLQMIRKALFLKVAIAYLIIFLLIAVGIITLHLFYSHRIAGPVYRLVQEAARIGRGDLAGNIKFRKKDNLTELADSLNDVAAGYRGFIDEVRESLAVIDRELKKMPEIAGAGREQALLKEAEAEITKNVRSIEGVLDKVRT